jgi:raffinose/stachyose/melibiose transport system permease protein
MISKKSQLTIIQLLLIIGALLFIFPVVMVYYNSFKSFGEILVNTISLPKAWTWANFTNAWKIMRFPRTLLNTTIVTILGVSGIIVLSSLAAFQISRVKTLYSRIMMVILMIPILVPINTVMITFTQVLTKLGLMNSLAGLIFSYWGLGMPIAIYLYVAFLSTIPKEIEESAMIDGCGQFRLFWVIIFPLLKPVTSTIAILDVMWIWNDFLLPLLTVNGSQKLQTIQLGAYTFFGQYVTQWNYALAGVALTITPTIVFFIFMQKYIVKGITSGSVKG